MYFPSRCLSISTGQQHVFCTSFFRTHHKRQFPKLSVEKRAFQLHEWINRKRHSREHVFQMNFVWTFHGTGMCVQKKIRQRLLSMCDTSKPTSVHRFCTPPPPSHIRFESKYKVKEEKNPTKFPNQSEMVKWTSRMLLAGERACAWPLVKSNV